MEIIDSDYYNGLLIEESLLEPLSFNEIKCTVNNVELIIEKTTGNIYHLYGIEIMGRELKKLSKLLHKTWHIKFFHNDEVIMVYPESICIVNKKTKAGLKEALRLGKAAGIPNDHLENIIPHSTQRSLV